MSIFSRPDSALRAVVLAGILSVFAPLCLAAPAADDDPRRTQRQLVLEAILGNKVMLSVDGNRRLLAVGQTGEDGVRVLRITADAVEVEVDGRHRRLRLGGHGVVTAPFRPRESVTVTITRGRGGMYSTVGSINGLPVSFLVDTGATSIAMNALQARRLAVDYHLTGEPIMVGTASGVTRAYQVRLDSVAVGGIEMRNVEAVVMEGGFPVQVLLGMSFLGQLEIKHEGVVMRLIKRF